MDWLDWRSPAPYFVVVGTWEIAQGVFHFRQFVKSKERKQLFRTAGSLLLAAFFAWFAWYSVTMARDHEYYRDLHRSALRVSST